MNRKLKNNNLLSLILGIICAVSLIVFLVLPVGHIDRGIAEGGVLGFTSVFGGTVKIGSGLGAFTYNFNPVNGWGIAIICMLIVSGVLSGVLAKHGRGFYYVSTIISIVAIIFLFMYNSKWIYANAPTLSGCEVGVGQIMAAVLMIIQALGNLVAAYLAKKI